MPTMTAPAPSVKPARQSHPLSSSLTLAINGQPYDLTVFKVGAPEVGRVFHLEKPDGDSYDVSEHDHGPECTCPDYECRRRGLDSLGCKHIRSLRALGPDAGGAGPARGPGSPAERSGRRDARIPPGRDAGRVL